MQTDDPTQAVGWLAVLATAQVAKTGQSSAFHPWGVYDAEGNPVTESEVYTRSGAYSFERTEHVWPAPITGKTKAQVEARLREMQLQAAEQACRLAGPERLDERLRQVRLAGG